MPILLTLVVSERVGNIYHNSNSQIANIDTFGWCWSIKCQKQGVGLLYLLVLPVCEASDLGYALVWELMLNFLIRHIGEFPALNDSLTWIESLVWSHLYRDTHKLLHLWQSSCLTSLVTFKHECHQTCSIDDMAWTPLYTTKGLCLDRGLFAPVPSITQCLGQCSEPDKPAELAWSCWEGVCEFCKSIVINSQTYQVPSQTRKKWRFQFPCNAKSIMPTGKILHTDLARFIKQHLKQTSNQKLHTQLITFSTAETQWCEAQVDFGISTDSAIPTDSLVPTLDEFAAGCSHLH